MDKQACALVKALKSIRYYGMHSNIIAYVLGSTIKDIFYQLDSEGRRGRWISKIKEYDMEIKPTKLVKGKEVAN